MKRMKLKPASLSMGLKDTVSYYFLGASRESHHTHQIPLFWLVCIFTAFSELNFLRWGFVSFICLFTFIPVSLLPSCLLFLILHKRWLWNSYRKCHDALEKRIKAGEGARKLQRFHPKEVVLTPKMLCAQSCLTLLPPHELWPTRLLCPWDFPGKNTGVGCHFLSQVIFQTQGWNPHFLHLLHWQVYSLGLCHLGIPPKC